MMLLSNCKVKRGNCNIQEISSDWKLLQISVDSAVFPQAMMQSSQF